MATMSSNVTERGVTTLRARLGVVPWLTVMPLAVVLAYADGFWMISLRGTVGAIERTQEPFAAWLRDSTLSLPFFVLAVIGALTLAVSRFGPVLRTSKTVAAAALMVFAAGTMVGVAELATSSAYDYHLQSTQEQQMSSMGSRGPTDPAARRASLVLQVRSVAYGSGLLLVTNVVLVGWVVAMRGGRLNVSTTRP